MTNFAWKLGFYGLNPNLVSLLNTHFCAMMSFLGTSQTQSANFKYDSACVFNLPDFTEQMPYDLIKYRK